VIDEQGKLWGRISIIDLGALLIVLLVGAGFLGLRGGTVAQTTQQPMEALTFKMLVRGLSIEKPKELFQPGDQPRVIIRNQPAGQVTIKAVQIFDNTVPILQANDKITYVPDGGSPFSRDILLTLEAQAQQTVDGAVVGGTKLKVATPIELETKSYAIKGSVIGVGGK
jgi:hypothetical protein